MQVIDLTNSAIIKWRLKAFLIASSMQREFHQLFHYEIASNFSFQPIFDLLKHNLPFRQHIEASKLHM